MRCARFNLARDVEINYIGFLIPSSIYIYIYTHTHTHTHTHALDYKEYYSVTDHIYTMQMEININSDNHHHLLA